MELFKDLPDSLKNIVVKQTIGRDYCDELTEDGKKCGEKFMYSINDYLFSERKEELKKVMVDCTKFCLKHLSDLIINGELKFGYETKENKKIISIPKENISIIGSKNNKSIIKLIYIFDMDSLNHIEFEFDTNTVDNIEEFRKKMIIDEKGYPEELNLTNNVYSVGFENSLISKPWRKFIFDCFKYEDLDYIKLVAVGDLNDKWYPKGGWEKELKLKNYMLVLGNLGITNVTTDRNFVGGVKRINK